jgi:hypothetical protein
MQSRRSDHTQVNWQLSVHAEKPCGSARFDPERLLKASGQQLSADEGRSLNEPRKVEGKQTMPLIQLVEILIVVGVLLWLVNRFIPMQASIKSILNGVVVIAVVLWLLNVFGLFHSLSQVHVGKG